MKKKFSLRPIDRRNYLFSRTVAIVMISVMLYFITGDLYRGHNPGYVWYSIIVWYSGNWILSFMQYRKYQRKQMIDNLIEKDAA